MIRRRHWDEEREGAIRRMKIGEIFIMRERGDDRRREIGRRKEIQGRELMRESRRNREKGEERTIQQSTKKKTPYRN